MIMLEKIRIPTGEATKDVKNNHHLTRNVPTMTFASKTPSASPVRLSDTLLGSKTE